MWRLLNTAVFGVALACGTAYGQMDGMKMPATNQRAAESTELVLVVNGTRATLSVADLRAMPQKTVRVHNTHTNADESYTGVPLSDLLAKAGFTPAAATQHEMLRSYVQAEGTDHYLVLYSLVEVEPSEHTGDVIVATSVDDHSLGADGQLKLVSTEDRKPQRWVRNLTKITVRQAE